MVQLDKMRLDTRKEEEREKESKRGGGQDPQIVVKKPSGNKGGVPEKIILVSKKSLKNLCQSLL